MKTRILPILVLLLWPLSPAFGEEELSDAAIKANLLGHWGGTRVTPIVMCLCSRDVSTRTTRWDMTGWEFYLDSEPPEILAVTLRRLMGVGPTNAQTAHRCALDLQVDGRRLFISRDPSSESGHGR
jgi:hypothetical protein